MLLACTAWCTSIHGSLALILLISLNCSTTLTPSVAFVGCLPCALQRCSLSCCHPPIKHRSKTGERIDWYLQHMENIHPDDSWQHQKVPNCEAVESSVLRWPLLLGYS